MLNGRKLKPFLEDILKVFVTWKLTAADMLHVDADVPFQIVRANVFILSVGYF